MDILDLKKIFNDIVEQQQIAQKMQKSDLEMIQNIQMTLDNLIQEKEKVDVALEILQMYKDSNVAVGQIIEQASQQFELENNVQREKEVVQALQALHPMLVELRNPFSRFAQHFAQEQKDLQGLDKKLQVFSKDLKNRLTHKPSNRNKDFKVLIDQHGNEIESTGLKSDEIGQRKSMTLLAFFNEQLDKLGHGDKSGMHLFFEKYPIFMPFFEKNMPMLMQVNQAYMKFNSMDGPSKTNQEKHKF